MSTVKPETRELVESLGADAVAALESGGEWEWTPETAEIGDGWCWYDSDAWEYRMSHHVSGFYIAGGKLHMTLYTVEEGSWDLADSMDVEDPHYDDWYEANFGWKNQQESWRPYLEEVAKTGNDYLGELIVSEVYEKVKEKWRYKVKGTVTGTIIFIAARRGREKWRKPQDLPETVREFFDIRYADRKTWVMNTEAYQWDTFTELVGEQPQECADGSRIYPCEIERHRYTQRQIVAATKRAAKRVLRDRKKDSETLNG